MEAQSGQDSAQEHTAERQRLKVVRPRGQQAGGLPIKTPRPQNSGSVRHRRNMACLVPLEFCSFGSAGDTLTNNCMENTATGSSITASASFKGSEDKKSTQVLSCMRIHKSPSRAF